MKWNVSVAKLSIASSPYIKYLGPLLLTYINLNSNMDKLSHVRVLCIIFHPIFFTFPGTYLARPSIEKILQWHAFLLGMNDYANINENSKLSITVPQLRGKPFLIMASSYKAFKHCYIFENHTTASENVVKMAFSYQIKLLWNPPPPHTHTHKCNGLVSSGNNPIPESNLIPIYVTIWQHYVFTGVIALLSKQ